MEYDRRSGAADICAALESKNAKAKL